MFARIRGTHNTRRADRVEFLGITIPIPGGLTETVTRLVDRQTTFGYIFNAASFRLNTANYSSDRRLRVNRRKIPRRRNHFTPLETYEEKA